MHTRKIHTRAPGVWFLPLQGVVSHVSRVSHGIEKEDDNFKLRFFILGCCYMHARKIHARALGLWFFPSQDVATRVMSAESFYPFFLGVGNAECPGVFSA